MSVAISLYTMYSFLGKRFHILKLCVLCGVCCTLFRLLAYDSASVGGCLGHAFGLLRRSPEYSTFKSVLLQSKEFVSARQSIGSDESIPV